MRSWASANQKAFLIKGKNFKMWYCLDSLLRQSRKKLRSIGKIIQTKSTKIKKEIWNWYEIDEWYFRLFLLILLTSYFFLLNNLFKWFHENKSVSSWKVGEKFVYCHLMIIKFTKNNSSIIRKFKLWTNIPNKTLYRAC